MRVDIEFIRWIVEERFKINKEDLHDIEFYENDKKLDIPKEVIDEFEFVGLNNIDFITTGFYKRDKDNIYEKKTN